MARLSFATNAIMAILPYNVKEPHASRFLLTCETLSSTGEHYAFTVFERRFRERDLPVSNRSDNGMPFASARALY